MDQGGALRHRGTRGRLAALAVVTAGATGMASMLASASHLDVSDPNDARGPLDVRVVEVVGTNSLRYRIGTYEDWRLKRIYDRGYVLVFFDTFGSQRYDYYALVRSTGLRLEATLWRDRPRRRDIKIANLRAYRTTRTNVFLRIPLGKMVLPDSRPHYFWYVQTLFTNDRCRRVCFDLAPDGAGVLEPNPNVPPSPPPTPAPTPTVTVSVAP